MAFENSGANALNDMDIEKFNKMNDLQGKIKGLRRLIDTVQWHISASKADSDRGRQSELSIRNDRDYSKRFDVDRSILPIEEFLKDYMGRAVKKLQALEKEFKEL